MAQSRGGQAVSELNVTICDGKYTIIQKPTGKTRVLRYGEEWDDVTGDNLICGLARELQESRERIKQLEDELNELRSDEAGLLNYNEELERRIKRLEKAGDAILNANNDDEEYEAMKQWREAKEDKL
jgi:predicted  nucleic acid-binding Zn-ribbon protein